MNQFQTAMRRGTFSSASNIRESGGGGSGSTPLLTPSGSVTGSVLSLRNPSPTGGSSAVDHSHTNWAIPTPKMSGSTQSLQSRAATYDSFVTVKTELKSPLPQHPFTETQQLDMQQNVARSRSFVVNRDRVLPQRNRSDEHDIADLDGQEQDAASITDVRLNIHRENSFLLKTTGSVPVTTQQLTSSRLPTGTVSYIAWDDAHRQQSNTDYPPQKIWQEETLLQFGHTAYHDDNLSQITDYLYIGDIYAANNEHLLCKLNVDAIVDLSNLRPEDVRKLKACHIPCTCPISSNHQRAKLIIGVKNSETEEIHIYFDEINRFVESIRRSGRKVLIHSLRGQGRAAVAVIQYLMQVHQLPMQSAFRVTKLARSLKINPVFRETLEYLESRLRSEGKLPPSEPANRLAPRPIQA
ncbi:hypothetical protein BV898_17301 [Hypsibius exemplaris]|uniref:protein-tyrosine-phosphatase n=1 Tax=Hypsibius exemplaris TaxID=2072580 RepID=A0A9X6NGL6_HYPEX|nr:hypothetical protein BV898_17301 [Hypsibius exemplaris]